VLNGGVFVASPAAITPTLSGVELVTNGNMEAGDPPTGWVSSSATLASVTDEHAGGTGTKSLQATAIATGYMYATQNITVTIGQWYRAAAWVKNGTGTGYARAHDGTSFPLIKNSSAAWASGLTVYRSLATVNQMGLVSNATAGQTLLLDDFSLQAISFPTTLGTPYDLGADGDFKVTLPALTAGTQVGQFFCLDNPLNPRNFGLIYHDGTSLTVVKCFNGVYTNLFTPVAATYGATKQLWLSKRGPTVTAYYGGVKIGTGAIDEDAIRNNTIVAPFSTYSGNTFANLDLQAA
jgi:hypothetical protein